jgi:hypothetical protein
MSVPIREPNDGASTDGPLNYAPKRVRLVETEPDSNPAGAPPKVAAAPRSAVEESTEPPWRGSKQGAAFAGDIAIRELRNGLALAPDRLPEPSPPLSTGSTGPRYRLASRHAGVVVVAALCGVIGYRWGSAPPSPSPQSALPSGQSNQQGLDSKRSAQSAEQAFASPAPAPAVVLQSDKQKSNCNSVRTAADGPASDACGSANDPTSVGAAQSPALSATGPRTILPYRDVRPSEPAPDPSEIAAKMRIGGDLMAHGDITAARTMFQRAAEAGEAAGAFALAETYDPAVLRQLHLRGGIAPDLAVARRWYEQAMAMGSTAAAERIVRLTQVSR